MDIRREEFKDLELQCLETGVYEVEPALPTVQNMVQLQISSTQILFSWSKFFRAVDFFINDILVIAFSLSDIVLDVLVCLQFYNKNEMPFFYISVAIFVLAQLSYSFLFTATWGKHLSPCSQILVFILVLPLGQLVPIFTWVESFRFEWLDRKITSLGLKPSRDPLATNDSENIY